jgi:acyl carrier protein
MRVAELASLIASVAGEDDAWAARITADTSVEDDLELESVELVALAAALRERYGPAVDLMAYLAGLDIDRLIGLTVGELAAYVDRAAT